MDIEANKVIVRRYMEMWNTGNIALADEVLSSAYLDYAHPEILSPEHVKQAVLKIRAASPNFHITIDCMISEGDIVALRNIIRRTHQEREVVSRVMMFIRIANGKMVELWTGTEVSG